MPELSMTHKRLIDEYLLIEYDELEYIRNIDPLLWEIEKEMYISNVYFKCVNHFGEIFSNLKKNPLTIPIEQFETITKMYNYVNAKLIKIVFKLIEIN